MLEAVIISPVAPISGIVVRPDDPSRVEMTTTDSNLWGGHSGHTYTLTRKPDGTTDVDVVGVREGKNLKGRALGLVLGIFGKRVLGKELGKTVKAIEARSNGAR